VSETLLCWNTFIVGNPQVKQFCYFNQFIEINDNHTSNLPIFYVNQRQVNHMGDRASKREREGEVVLVERQNGMA
jgi:hypothetical protein